MTPPANSTHSQEGFILIEVLVSALILAIVGGAVLTLVTATTRGAASQRVHSVAYGLAQEAQAVLRTKPISELTAYSNSTEKSVGGTIYTIETQSVFVSNTTQTVSCGENDEPDYIRLTSTVSAPGMVNPVTIRSVVSPTNGSVAPNVGSMLLWTKNAANEPLSGVQIAIKGESIAFNKEHLSEPTGCTSFGDIPAQKYLVTFSAPGLVNKKGELTSEEHIEVTSANTWRGEPFFFDRPASLKPEFVVMNNATGALEKATVDSMEVFNPAGPLSTPKLWSTTPVGTRVPTIEAKNLYPFSKSKYAVYAGTCEKDNPDPTGTVTANDLAMGLVELPPEGFASPRIQLPALNLTVKYETGVVEGATVTVTDTKCGTKRTYVTNNGGHLSTSTTGPTEAGLPWSTYKICVLATVKGKSRRYATPSTETVAVENLTKTGTPLEVNLAKAEESTKAC